MKSCWRSACSLPHLGSAAADKADAPARSAAAARPYGAAPRLGKVLEMKDVESYTYLRLKTSQGETWAAVPTTRSRRATRSLSTTRW